MRPRATDLVLGRTPFFFPELARHSSLGRGEGLGSRPRQERPTRHVRSRSLRWPGDREHLKSSCGSTSNGDSPARSQLIRVQAGASRGGYATHVRLSERVGRPRQREAKDRRVFPHRAGSRRCGVGRRERGPYCSPPRHTLAPPAGNQQVFSSAAYSSRFCEWWVA